MIPAHTPQLSLNEAYTALFRMNKQSISQFEKELSDFLGVKYVALCASGRQALFHLLKYAGAPSKVVMPAFTADIVADVVKYAGAKPVLADVRSEDYALDSENVDFAKTGSKILISVDPFGNPARLDELHDFCQDNELFFIDDAATAFGARYKNRCVGSFADATIFSFGLGKSLALGGLGSVATNNEGVHSFIKQRVAFSSQGLTNFVRNFVASVLTNETVYSYAGHFVKQKRLKTQYAHLSSQLAANPSQYLASLGIVKLRDFSLELEHRRKVSLLLRKKLSEHGFVVQKENGKSTFNRLMFSTDYKANTILRLKKQGVEAVSLFGGFPVERGVCPVSDSLASRVLGIPVDARVVPLMEELFG